MCAPIPVIAAIFFAGQSYMDTEASNRAADYNADVAERNADRAATDAAEADRIGYSNVNKLRKSTDRFKGSQVSALSSSGAKVGVGSTQGVIQDTNVGGEQDAMSLRYNITKEVEAKMFQSSDYREGARMYRSSKKNSLLSAAGGAFSGYTMASGAGLK